MIINSLIQFLPFWNWNSPSFLECVIQKVMFDETFGPDEGSDDNYSSQDEIESDSDKDDEWLPWTIAHSAMGALAYVSDSRGKVHIPPEK